MASSAEILLMLICTLATARAAGYANYKLYDVTPKSREECSVLHGLSKAEQLYDFFSMSRLPGHIARVMVHPAEVEHFELLLQQRGMKYGLINENVGDTLEREFQLNQKLRSSAPYAGKGRLSNERYYSHGEINNYIEDLARRYPQRVFLKTVGRSYEGRSLKTLTITNGDGRSNKNVILMDGGFHAREWISPAAVLYAIDQLVENYSGHAQLLQDYDWVVLPVVNADGYEYTQISPSTRSWRKTRKPNEYLGQICYGTDPNRNFDFHWRENGSSTDACSNTYAGPKPFSEPEAIVVRDLIQSLKEHGIMYLTIHSYGSMLLHPWGWTSELPDTWEDLQDVAQAGADAIYLDTGSNYTIGSSTNVLYAASGASDDHAFNEGFPISYTMELPAGGTSGFDPPPSSIDSYVKETWTGIRAMALRLLQKYPLRGN